MGLFTNNFSANDLEEIAEMITKRQKEDEERQREAFRKFLSSRVNVSNPLRTSIIEPSLDGHSSSLNHQKENKKEVKLSLFSSLFNLYVLLFKETKKRFG